MWEKILEPKPFETAPGGSAGWLRDSVGSRGGCDSSRQNLASPASRSGYTYGASPFFFPTAFARRERLLLKIWRADAELTRHGQEV